MKLKNKQVLMIVEDLYEDLELWYPKYRLTEEGATVVVAGPESGKIYKGKHGYPCKSDAALSNIKEKDFDAFVIPGGFAPDQLRRSPIVLNLVRAFHKKEKLIAHICHAGWIPISAGIMKDFRCTSTPGIKDDLINAGAVWTDESVVIDRNMISSRRPDDLPDFCREIVKWLEK